MLKRLIVAAAFGAALACPAYAQTPANADDCFKQVIDLQKAAAEKKLSDDKNAQIEDLLTKMEGECEAQKFAESASTASDIKAAIEGK